MWSLGMDNKMELFILSVIKVSLLLLGSMLIKVEKGKKNKNTGWLNNEFLYLNKYKKLCFL